MLPEYTVPNNFTNYTNVLVINAAESCVNIWVVSVSDHQTSAMSMHIPPV